MLANAARREIDQFAQHALKLLLVHVLPGAVQIDIDREWMRHADGIADLQRASLGKSGRDDVLGEVAAT